jgi:hypothetical protein
MLPLAACNKPAELVHLTVSNDNGRMFYTFTYQGGSYSPQDSTVVVTDKYRFTLPANEPTGYVIPAGYISATGTVTIKSAFNKLIKIAY